MLYPFICLTALAADAARELCVATASPTTSCAERASLTVNVTPHTFRRSCTTELIRGGAGMYHVKELLGHESLDTLQHCAKLTIQDLKKEHQRCHPREKDAEG